MSLSSSVYESGVVKQVQKTENGAKSKQGSGGHAPNATDGQSGTGNSSTLSPSPSLTPPPFQCLPLTKPTRAVSESQQGSCVSSECEGASSNEQNPLKLRETAKRHSPGVIAGASCRVKGEKGSLHVAPGHCEIVIEFSHGVEEPRATSTRNQLSRIESLRA